MAPKWNPQTVLGIDPASHSFTCIGTTQKGARCRQSMISAGDLAGASEILDKISAHRPQSGFVKNALPGLAYLMLCPRWHRKAGYSQADEIVRKWESMIERHCVSTTQTTLESSSRSTRSSASSSSTPLAPRHSLDEAVAESLARRSCTAFSSAQRTGLSKPPIQYGRSRSVQIWAESNPATWDPSLRAWVTPPLSPRPTRRNNGTSSSALSSPPPEWAEASPSPSSNPTHSTTPAFPTRRKPITEPCSICLSPISTPSVAVWCRAQCGQNVHRTCFGEWRKQCLSTAAQERRGRGFGIDGNEDGGREGDEEGVREMQRLERAVRCMFCRARWRWEWEEEED